MDSIRGETLANDDEDDEDVVIYFHDPVEVHPRSSWTGLCPPLVSARRVHISKAMNPRVIDLFGYARPDAVITKGGTPVVSIEQTTMNPSGHNIPQRFSFHCRAAELGVPSILYYPEHAKRKFSDPNERNLQVRVPLAQKRLTSIYSVPALSVFWPTNPKTKLPDGNVNVQTEMPALVEEILENNGSKGTTLVTVTSALAKMDAAVAKYASDPNDYDQNPSVRAIFADGLPTSMTPGGFAIDPPNTSTLFRTPDFLDSLKSFTKKSYWNEIEEKLLKRELTLVFHGTANHKGTDSEHPWPGYLTLLDILYLRKDGGRSHNDRVGNLVYDLPVKLDTFILRLLKKRKPTATRIVDSFADLVMLEDGIVAGEPMRVSRQIEPIAE